MTPAWTRGMVPFQVAAAGLSWEVVARWLLGFSALRRAPASPTFPSGMLQRGDPSWPPGTAERLSPGLRERDHLRGDRMREADGPRGDLSTFPTRSWWSRWRWETAPSLSRIGEGGGQCGNLERGLPCGQCGDPAACREDLLSGLVLPPGGASPARFPSPWPSGPFRRLAPPPGSCAGRRARPGSGDAVSAN